MQFTEFPSTKPAIHIPNWALILLFIAYALPGNVGHVPWRGDDALHIGVVYSMLQDGNWLVPHIAGVPYLEWPPLLYWLGGICGIAFGWLLPLHDAIRLGGVAALTLLLVFLRFSARELYGREAASAAAMLALGSLGLLIHAHEMQPQILVAACIAATLYGLAHMRTNPRRGALIAGIASAAAFLSSGLDSLLICLPLYLALPISDPLCRSRQFLRAYIHAFWPLLLIISAWLLPLAIWQADYLTHWWQREWLQLLPQAGSLKRSGALANLLGWFAWPLWPLMLWSLWHRRGRLQSFGHTLPLLGLLLPLLLVIGTGSARPANAVPLLPGLILIAAGELCRLRRGAANAFDWFGLMTFTLLGIALWLAWAALNLGWPARLSHNIARLFPGYHPNWAWHELGLALALSTAWIIAMLRIPFFQLRGAVHWALGVTLSWGLATSLWLSWFDYAKNHESIAQQIALQTAQYTASQGASCIATIDVGDAQRAALYYFANLRLDTRSTAQKRCSLLLSYSIGKRGLPNTGADWEQIWHTQRGQGRLVERFALYRKESSAPYSSGN